MAVITSVGRIQLDGVDIAPYIDSRHGIQLTDWQREVLRRIPGARRGTIRLNGYWGRGPSLYELMPTICAWLTVNGIPPERVPITEVPRVDRTRRTIRLWVYDEPKRVDHHHRVVGRRTAVYLAVRPPAILRGWLAGKVRP